MQEQAQTKFKVLSIIFPGFNTLDLNGPLDVFTKSGLTEHFEVDIAADHEANANGPATKKEDDEWDLIGKKSKVPCDITVSTEGVRVQTTLDLNDDLVRNASKNYDVLHIAGGGSWGVATQVAKKHSRFMRLIQTFAETAPPEGKRRILLSICTGAMFPATMGVFDKCFCTTHWGIYEKVAEVLYKTRDPGGTFDPKKPIGTGAMFSVPQVIKARFVDAGKNDNGVQIMSSGGISCGIDAALHVVRSLVGTDESIEVAKVLDYLWHQTEGVIFGDLDADAEEGKKKEKKAVRDDGTGTDELLGTRVI